MANDPNRPGDGQTHGASTVTPVGGKPGGAAPPPPAKKGPGWLKWLLIPLALILLFLLLRSCGDKETMQAESEVRPLESTTPTAVETQLPATAAVSPVAGDLNARLQQYLASPEAAGRRFTFDNLHFATNSAELPAGAAQTVQAVAATMAQYPNARVRIEGYADARGSDASNAQLGARRAEAVARALIGAGVNSARVTSATGSESNPVDTNATPQGQAQNRRTDLVVVSK